MIVQSLRDVPGRRIRPVAYCHEQTSIGRDRDAASGLGAKPFGRQRRLSPKDDLRVAQRKFGYVQPAPRDIRIAVAAAWIGIRALDEIEEGEKDLVVGRKMRVKRHVEEANVLSAG